MRHLKKKKFGRGINQKRKLLRSLASALTLYEKIITNLKNAKATKAYTEKLITKSKNVSLHNRRFLLMKLSAMAAKKLLEVLGSKYQERKGGYIRMVKLTHHSSGSSKVLLELL